MILFSFIIIYTASFFIPDDMPTLYGLMAELLLVLLCYNSFKKTSYEDIINKSGWFCMTTWTILNMIVFTWFSDMCVLNIWILIFESVLFGTMLVYSQFRSYSFSGDDFNKEGCFLVFKKPKNFFDFMHSCIFRPVSSVSIVSDNIWFGYTLGKPYRCEIYDQHQDNWLLRIPIDHGYVIDMLEPLLGSRWSPLNNCCHAIQRIFPDIKFKLFDSLPCHLIKTIMKDRKNEL